MTNQTKAEKLLGQKFRLRGKPMTGIDKQVYCVLTVMAGGRGWFNRKYFVVDPQAVIDVEVVRVKNNYAEVHFITGGDTLIKNFSRRPYIRKDGTHNPIVWDSTVYGPRLCDQYESRIMTGWADDDSDRRGKGILIETKFLKEILK